MTEPYMIITCAVILRAEQLKLSRLAYKGRLTKNLALLDRRAANSDAQYGTDCRHDKPDTAPESDQSADSDARYGTDSAAIL